METREPAGKGPAELSPAFWWCAVCVTFAVEVITIFLRIKVGSATSFERSTQPPLLLRVHHMFWPVFVLPVAPFLRNRTAVHVLLGISLGLIASDLIHHFVVLPLWVGNIGWHWP
jgi:hypothetical protein